MIKQSFYEPSVDEVLSFVFSLKPSEDSHMKLGPPRHKQYSAPNRPPTPRTQKHRLSADPNLQIPEILNSASKKDLLRRVCHRCAHGERRTGISRLCNTHGRKDDFETALVPLMPIVLHVV